MANSPNLWLGGLLWQTCLKTSHILNLLFCLGVYVLKNFVLKNIIRKQHNHYRFPNYKHIYLLPFQIFLGGDHFPRVQTERKEVRNVQKNVFNKCYGSNCQTGKPPSVLLTYYFYVKNERHNHIEGTMSCSSCVYQDTGTK